MFLKARTRMPRSRNLTQGFSSCGSTSKTRGAASRTGSPLSGGSSCRRPSISNATTNGPRSTGPARRWKGAALSNTRRIGRDRNGPGRVVARCHACGAMPLGKDSAMPRNTKWEELGARRSTDDPEAQEAYDRPGSILSLPNSPTTCASGQDSPRRNWRRAWALRSRPSRVSKAAEPAPP